MESDTPFFESGFRVLPDCCVEMFFNYRRPGDTAIAGRTITDNTRSVIVSRMSQFMDVKSEGEVGCIAVCFHVAGAYRFLSMPMNEITNQAVDIADLQLHGSSELEEKISAARNNNERVNIIQQFFLAQLRKNNKEDKAIDFCTSYITATKGLLPVELLAARVGLSNRQLIRRFYQHVGVSPKDFSKITKFICALAELKKYPESSLTEIAYESGYYDQAHFIHDVKEYSGMSPRQLMSSCNILM